MLNRMIVIVMLSSVAPFLTSCGGRLYKVAPIPAGLPPEITTGAKGGLSIGAVALDGQQSYDRFEANLPLAGVIAVDVRMMNRTDTTIATRSLRFELRDPAGGMLKQLVPKKALGAVMKYYGNKYYAKIAYQRTLEDYESIALKQDSSIEPDAEIRGIVFFQTKRETTSIDGFILSVAGLTEPVNLQLHTAHK